MNAMDDLEVEREIANLALNDNDAEQQHVEHLARQNLEAQNPQLPHGNDPAAPNDVQPPGNLAAQNEPRPAGNPGAQNENQHENELQNGNGDENENIPQNGDPVENRQGRPRGSRGGNQEKRKFFREKLNPYHRNLENLATFQAMLVSASTRVTARSEKEKRRGSRKNNTENKG